MARNAKQALLTSTAVQPPPVVEERRWSTLDDVLRWSFYDEVMGFGETTVTLMKPAAVGKTEATLREMISNPRVEAKETPRGR